MYLLLNFNPKNCIKILLSVFATNQVKITLMINKSITNVKVVAIWTYLSQKRLRVLNSGYLG